MLILTATTHSLELVTSTAQSVDYVTSFVDITTTTFVPGSTDGNVAAATTTALVAAPAASTQRQIKHMSVRNAGGSANVVTIQKDVSGSNRTIFSVSLAAGDELQYTDGEGFRVFDASGNLKVTTGSGGAAGSNTLGMSNLGNTSGTTGVVSGTGLAVFFAGGNNLTISQSINGQSATLTFSAAAQTAQTQNVVVPSAGTQTATSGTAVFSNSHNVTFGMSGSSRITASASFPAQTNQQMTMFATGNTTQSSTGTTNASSLIFRGAGVASVGITDGSVVISVPAGGGAAGTNTLGMSNLGNTSGTTGVVTGSNVQVVFVGGNNLTISQSINGSSATLTFSAAAQSNQQMTMFATGNTTQSSTGTSNASSLIFRGGGDISVGITGGSVVVSGAQTNQQITMFAASNTTQSSTGTANASSLIFAGAGNVSVGITGGSVVISGAGGGGANETMFATGNTTQSSTGTRASSSIIYAASGGISVGITGGSVLYSGPATSSLSATGAVSISTNGSTISIGAPPAFTHSQYNPFAEGAAVAGQHGQGSLHIHYLPETPNFQFDRLCMDIFWSNASNSTGSATLSFWAGIYTRNASTLSLVASTSRSQGITFSGTGGNQSLQAGGRIFTIGWTTTITENDLWVGIISRTTSGGANGSASQFHVSDVATNFSGIFGVASNATQQDGLGLGYYTASTTAIPGSIGFSQINGTASMALRAPMYLFLSQTA